MITLSTGVAPGSSCHCQKGIYFDLKARSSPVRIVAITCATNGEVKASMYTCQGTSSSQECDGRTWSLVGQASLQASKKGTKVVLGSPIIISPMSVAGMFVHCSGEGEVFFSGIQEAGAICAEDANLQLLPGRFMSSSIPFGDVDGDVRVLAGAITYEVVLSPASSTGDLLWSDPVFSDLTVLAGTRSFPAHRAMLAAASSVFRGMLDAPMRESLEHRIEIDAPPAAVESVLKYIYTGEVPLASQAHDVLPLAHQYELADLAAWCSSSLVSHCSPSTAHDVILALRPFKDIEPMQQAWDQLICLAESDPRLVRPFIQSLASGSRV